MNISASAVKIRFYFMKIKKIIHVSNNDRQRGRDHT